MPLRVGARLGPYEIVALIGAGDLATDPPAHLRAPRHRRNRASKPPVPLVRRSLGEGGSPQSPQRQLPRDGVSGRRDAGRAAGPRGLAARAGAALRRRDRRRARLRASPRHHSSRPEAGQRHADGIRGEAARSRSRQAEGGLRAAGFGLRACDNGDADRGGQAARHRGLHGARAGRGERGRRAVGYLLVGVCPLRDDGGPAGVRRHQFCGGAERDSQR